MSTKGFPVFFLTAALMVCASPAFATPPSVEGQLLKLDGKTPWVLHTLEFLTIEGKKVATAITKKDGSFTLPALKPGKYQLKFGKATFAITVTQGWKKVVILASDKVGPKDPPLVFAEKTLVTKGGLKPVGVTVVEEIVVATFMGVTVVGVVGGTYVVLDERQDRKHDDKIKRYIRGTFPAFVFPPTSPSVP